MKTMRHPQQQLLLTLIGFWPHFVYCQLTMTMAAAATATTDQWSHMVYASEATLLTTSGSSAMEYESPTSTFRASTSSSSANYNDDEMRMNEIVAEVPDFEEDSDVMVDSDIGMMTETSSTRGHLSASSAKLDKWKSLKNRYRITSIQTNCSRDTFEMHLELNRAFHGLLYAKDFAHECRAHGTDERNVTLRLPTSGCGVRVEMHRQNDDVIELSVRVMLQIEEKLRQSIDILRTVRCKLPLMEMGLSLSMNGKKNSRTMATSDEDNRMRDSRQRATIRNGRMKINKRYPSPSDKRHQDLEFPDHNLYLDQGRSLEHEPTGNIDDLDNDQEEGNRPSGPEVSETTATQSVRQSPSSYSRSVGGTPRVRVWLELGGPDGSGVVVVGQATTLTVRAIVPGSMGVRIVDCAALDGLGESTQQLLDERGCPIDEQVMPALHTRIKPAEEGWSKAHEDDLLDKTYTATFPAFKFPDRERLHVSCGVQLCKGYCPDVNCRTSEQLMLSTDKHLARIDVFNSLAVTAPQIEVDRLRYGRNHHNMSVEEQPPYIRPLVSEGTLCLSVSKLAISFCILGLIFLLAVIVAVFSLVRSRRRFKRHYCSALSANSSTRLHPAEVCTSMFSSSSDSAQSARFGSKLFIPYYPSTLPYGRVY